MTTTAQVTDTAQAAPNFAVDLSEAKEFRKGVFEYCQKTNKNLYPHKFKVNVSLFDFINKYNSLKDNETQDKTKEDKSSIAARVYNIRKSSKKLYFLDLKYLDSNLQVLANAKTFENQEEFMGLMPKIKRGDHIGVEGYAMRTKAGELSINAHNIILLTPCFENIPTDWYGLKDVEIRYRHRYLDFIMNAESRNTIITRSRAIQFLRNFLINLGFIEVETPILHPIVGGATAKPFVTFYNDISTNMYLRVAPELYLKKMIVGGFNRVFEIGKVFRNEGMDPTHNPEFTSCEFYMAYADYNDLMKITESLMSDMVKTITGSRTLKFPNKDGTDYEINFDAPFKRLDVCETIEKKLGVKFNKSKFGSEESRIILDNLCRKHNVKCSEPRTEARLMDKLIGDFVECDAINPTFLINHPLFMSPLAKSHRNIPELSERFELFVACSEIVNAYTENNDLFQQTQAFKDQASARLAGDDESMLVDHNFLSSLSYGLPPTAGWGIGIDRLVMLLTGKNTIKEVIAFPTTKPETNESEQKTNLAPNNVENAETDSDEYCDIVESFVHDGYQNTDPSNIQSNEKQAVENAETDSDEYCDIVESFVHDGYQNTDPSNIQSNEKQAVEKAETDSDEYCDIVESFVHDGYQNTDPSNIQSNEKQAVEKAETDSDEYCDIVESFVHDGYQNTDPSNIQSNKKQALENAETDSDEYCDIVESFVHDGYQNTDPSNIQSTEKQAVENQETDSDEYCDIVESFVHDGYLNTDPSNIQSNEKQAVENQETDSDEYCDIVESFVHDGYQNTDPSNIQNNSPKENGLS